MPAWLEVILVCLSFAVIPFFGCSMTRFTFMNTVWSYIVCGVPIAAIAFTFAVYYDGGSSAVGYMLLGIAYIAFGILIRTLFSTAETPVENKAPD